MQARKLPLLLALFLGLCVGLPLKAATYFVSPSGNNSRTTSQAQHIDSAWATLTHAIAQAANGDVIIMAAGTYTENPNINKRLTVIGAGSQVAASGGTNISGAITISATTSGSQTVDVRNLRVIGAGGTGFTISAEYVTLVDVTVTGKATGVNISATTTNLKFYSVNLVANTGVGINVANNIGVNGWEIINSQIAGNNGVALSFVQTTTPSAVTVTNFLMRNCNLTNNNTIASGAQHVWQCQKLENAVIENCVFRRAAASTTNPSNLINLNLTGKVYSNLTFRHCRFYTTFNETGLQSRAIYVQPAGTDPVNSGVQNIIIEGCAMSNPTTGGQWGSVILFQNRIDNNNNTVRYNVIPKIFRTQNALANFGPANPASTAVRNINFDYNYYNTTSRPGPIFLGVASTTSGSNIVTALNFNVANAPTAPFTLVPAPRWGFSGITVLAGGPANPYPATAIANFTAPATLTMASNAATTATVYSGYADTQNGEGANQAVITTHWTGLVSTTGLMTGTPTTGYAGPVMRTKGSFQGSHATVNAAAGALTTGDTLWNLPNKTLDGADATISIPAGITATISMPGAGRFNDFSATKFTNLSIPSGSTLRLLGDLIVTGTLTINGALNLNNYNLVLAGGNITGSGVIAGGDANTFSGVVIRGSARTIPLKVSGVLNHLATLVDSSGSTIQLTNPLSLNGNGQLFQGSGSVLNLNGQNLGISGRMPYGAGTISGGTGSSVSVSSSLPVALPALTISGTLSVSGTNGAYLAGAVSTGNLTLTGSSPLRIFANTLSVSGLISGTNLLADRSSNLSLTTSGTAIPAGIGNLNNLTITHSGGSDVTTLNGNLTIWGTYTLNTGFFDISGRRLNFSHTAAAMAGSGAFRSNSSNTVLYANGPTTGGPANWGTLRFAAAPNNLIGTLWTHRNVTLNNAVNIRGRLRIRYGTFNASSNEIKFSANSSGSGRLDTVGPGATVSNFDNIKQVRHIGGLQRWVFLGTGIQGRTLADWQESSLGTNGINFTFNNTGGQQPSVWRFDTPSNNWVAENPALTNVYQPGFGVRVFVRSAFLTLNNGPAGIYGPTEGQGTLHWTGSPIVGSVTRSGLSTAANQWVLMANPYINPIDWTDETNIVRTNIGNNMFYWSGNSYRGMVKVGPVYSTYNSGTSIIPASQGFFVRSTATGGQLQFTENAKRTGTNIIAREGSSDDRVMRVKMTGNNANDEALLIFGVEPTASAGADEFDITKFQNGDINVATFNTAGEQLLADFRPMPSEETIIPLRVGTTAAGNFNLNFEGLPANASFKLKDNFAGTITPIVEGEEYPFSINSTPGTGGNSRFEIIVTPQTPSSLAGELGVRSMIFPNPTNGVKEVSIAIKGATNQLVSYRISDMSGRVIASGETMGDVDWQTIKVPVAGLQSGLYHVNIISGQESKTHKLVVGQ